MGIRALRTNSRKPHRHPTLIDATELIQNPIRTGIQRVTRALLQHWPHPTDLHLVRFTEEHGLVLTPPELLPLLRNEATPPADIRHLLSTPTPPAPTNLPILIPELFWDPARCAHYHALLAQNPAIASFIAFDFIPWLHPEAIGVDQSAHLMPYLQLIRGAKRVGFISTQTRTDYTTRITRNPHLQGPVFPLGADGLATPRQTWRPGRRTYLCLGSIDGRKNQHLVLDAFETLWSQNSNAHLTMIGTIFQNNHIADLAARIERLQSTEPRFRHAAGIPDDDIRALFTDARASIYASELEGFGLPPLESLHCGVPTIVSTRLPSIQDLPEAGQIRLDPITPATLTTALQTLEDDKSAARLWRAAAALETPTWSAMASDVAQWVHG